MTSTAVTLPKPMTSGLEARGRFGKQDFVYLSKWLAKADLPLHQREEGYGAIGPTHAVTVHSS
jgi:hypothetical protein